MIFDWSATNAINYTLNGNLINGNTTSLKAPSTTGTTNYVLSAFNGAGDSVTRSLSVNVVGLPVINTFTGPSIVFSNTPLTLSWTGTGISKYEIKSNNASSGISTTEFDLGSSITTNVTPTTAGTYTYTLSGYNTANAKVDLNKSVVVESDPTFTGFTVNGSTSISVTPSAALTFAGSGFSSGAVLQGRNSGNTADAVLPTTASASVGTTTYYAAATKTLNSLERISALRSVTVAVVANPTIGTITSPSNVFANSAFSMTWSGTNVTSYAIRGNVAASGVSTTDVDLGTTASRSITPTSAGTYTYTITATNAAGVTTTSTRNVTVEGDPIFTGFTVNGSTSVTVAPSAALTFAGSGFSAGAVLQGRNSGNTADAVLPTTASANIGSTTYYAAATKDLNNVSRHSTVRSVTVAVVANPTIGTISSPNNVFANSAFSMTWSGTNVVNYSIRGNVAASGVSTTDVNLGTTASRSITPTAAGTYTYTITATNAAGVETTSTRVVTVESDPTFTGFTVNGGTTINVGPTGALNYASSGFSSGSIFVARNSSNSANATNPTTAPATVGTYTYYAASTKSLNSITRYSGLRSVVVNVVETWIATTPTYTSWVNSGGIYGCANWSPDPSTVNTGVGFTQTATDCEQNQTRNRQNREQETTTLAIRNSGSVIVENQTLTNQTSTRAATGTKVTKVCYYNASNYVYRGGYPYYQYMWNGSRIASEKSTVISRNGYTYSVGSFVKRYTTYDQDMSDEISEYYICRE